MQTGRGIITDTGWAVLHEATFRGDLNILKLLLNHHQTDVNVRGVHRSTALHIAADMGWKEAASEQPYYKNTRLAKTNVIPKKLLDPLKSTRDLNLSVVGLLLCCEKILSEVIWFCTSRVGFVYNRLVLFVVSWLCL